MEKPRMEKITQMFLSADRETQEAIYHILVELDAAKVKHPKWKNDDVWRAAVVVEEAGELIRDALNKDVNGMKLEAIQTGAMALRFLTETKDK